MLFRSRSESTRHRTRFDAGCADASTSRSSYIYEVCLFDEARQKPLKGGATFSLGFVVPDNVTTRFADGVPTANSRLGMKLQALRRAPPSTTASSTTPAAPSAGTVPTEASRFDLSSLSPRSSVAHPIRTAGHELWLGKCCAIRL